VKKYFDTRSKPVQALQTLLKELRATDMTIELPGLAGSLDAVRVLQLAREKRMR
jgi:uroporphyrin-3 C-methyltransferase